MHVYMYICMYACMYVCMYICPWHCHGRNCQDAIRMYCTPYTGIGRVLYVFYGTVRGIVDRDGMAQSMECHVEMEAALGRDCPYDRLDRAARPGGESAVGA